MNYATHDQPLDSVQEVVVDCLVCLIVDRHRLLSRLAAAEERALAFGQMRGAVLLEQAKASGEIDELLGELS